MKQKSTEFGGWSLSDVVEGRYFRVPDYQRGYAWSNRQLEEFWDDLNAVVESGGRHYIGAITVKAFSDSAFDYQDWEYGNGKARRILFIRQADYRNYTSDLFERMANDYERILGAMHANGF